MQSIASDTLPWKADPQSGLSGWTYPVLESATASCHGLRIGSLVLRRTARAHTRSISLQVTMSPSECLPQRSAAARPQLLLTTKWTHCMLQILAVDLPTMASRFEA